MDEIKGLLSDRGYKIYINNEYILGTNDKDNVIVFHHKGEVLEVKTLSAYIDEALNKNCKILIVVHLDNADIEKRNNLSVITKKMLKMKNIKYIPEIEFFKESFIGSNITQHSYVPKHELVAAENEKKLLDSFYATKNDFPKIKICDPVVRWYGWKLGSIIKITRDDGTIYYRVIVE